MNRKALSLAVLVAGAYPASSYALSLGDIESNSNLNQPLRAKIELLSASAADAKQLRVRLASSSVFSRVGVDRPAFLDSLRFTSTVQNGKPVVLVTSDAPISEPFVNFLVEVSWPQGQLLKEYTVMLNPPVLMQPGTAFAGNEAAVRAEPRPVAGTVNRAAPAANQQQMAAQQQAQQQQRARQQQSQQQAQQRARQQQAQQQQRARQQQAQQQTQQQRARQQQAQQQQRARQQQAQARQQAAQNTARAASRTYRVRSGDTLFKVASRLQQPGVNVDQMMMALYRANPKAFIKGNINGLKAGAILRAPAASAAKSTSRAQARRQVRQQYADWKKFRATLAKKTVPQSSSNNQSSNQNKSQSAKTNNTPSTAKTAANDKARLEVLGKNTSGAADSGNSAAGSERLSQLEQQLALARESMVSRQRENKELKSRVNDLESMLRKKNRLIALRDDQLAQLQKQLSDNGIEVATPGLPATTAGNNTGTQNNAVSATGERTQGSDIQNQVANTSQPAQNQVVRAQQPENTVTPRVDNTQNATSAQNDTNKPANVFADQQESGDDLMSMLMSPMAWKIGAGALFSLLLLWLLSRLLGRRKSSNKKAPLVADEPVIFDADNDSMGAMREDQPFRELEAELNKAERGALEDDDPFGVGGVRTDNDSTAATSDIVEARAEQDEDETLMEANVYIAYGLHQQAEGELQKALEKHPNRLEYRHKLLENYFASNNRDEFDRNAQLFLETPGADRGGKMWQEIADWGKKISPDNTLYTEQKSSGMGAALAGGAAVAGAAASAIALGSDDEQDLAFNEEQDGLGDLDFSSDVGADDVAGEENVNSMLNDLQDDDDLGLDDFDFNLDDLESDLGGGLDEDELPAAETPSLDQPMNNVSEELAVLPDQQELAETIDDDLDFSLDDLAKELQQEDEVEANSVVPDLRPAAESTADSGSADMLDFDELLSDNVSEPDSGADSTAIVDPVSEDGDEDDGIGLIGGLAAGAAAAAGAATAAVISGKDKVDDALGSMDNSVDDALNFDDDLPELPDLSIGETNEPQSDTLDSLDFGQELGELPDLDEALGKAELPSLETAGSAVAGGLVSDSDGDEITALDFDLSDIDLDAGPEPVQSLTEASTEDSDEMSEAGNMDFPELASAADNEIGAADNVTNLNLHLDKESGLKKILPEDTFYTAEEDQQQAGGDTAAASEEDEGWMGDIDDALSFLDMPDEEIDLHEAHISTKLDLARAYLDMGDIEGARSTLEEVMVEGNDTQRQEAETLLHETG